MALHNVLLELMRRYVERVPDVTHIQYRMVAEGLIESPEEIQNDHIAFRTMGVAQLGVRSLEKIFLHYGYTRRDSYDFEQKKLNAYWYDPPRHRFPRVFISELRALNYRKKPKTPSLPIPTRLRAIPLMRSTWMTGHRSMHSCTRRCGDCRPGTTTSG